MSAKDKIKDISVSISEIQLQKLRLEVEDLKNRIGWQQKFLSLLPFLTILVAICGLWYNFYQFSETQKKLGEREMKARLDEFRKPLYEKRLNLYLEAVDSAAIIASSSSIEEQNKAKEKFMQLYTGSLHLVSDEKFAAAKVAFFKCLDWEDQCESENQRNTELRRLSQALAIAAQESITDTWFRSLATPSGTE